MVGEKNETTSQMAAKICEGYPKKYHMSANGTKARPLFGIGKISPIRKQRNEIVEI